MNEDPLARALSEAGGRRPPPVVVAGQVRDAVERGWLADLARRRRRRQLLLAAAAIVLAGVMLPLLLRPPTLTNAGTYLASRGNVTVDTGSGQPVTGGLPLPAGTRIHSGHDGLVLIANGPVSVRVGPDSVARLESIAQIELTRGRIYLDFGTPGISRQPVRLVTPLGIIEHLGTQFQAQVDDERLSVLVREGRVRLTSAGGPLLIDAREAVEIDATGRVQRHESSGFGAAWAWTDALHPDFAIDGRTLGEFLDWFARETGLRIDYDSPAARVDARNTRLNGSIAGLSPQQALSAVLASTQFRVEPAQAGVLRLTEQARAHDKLRTHAAGVRTADSVAPR